MLTANHGTDHEDPMEELEKGLKELKSFATHRKSNSINKPDPTELPETKPPTKEHTWADP